MKELLEKIDATKVVSTSKKLEGHQPDGSAPEETKSLGLAVHDGFVRIHVRHPIRGHETTVSIDENIAAMAATSIKKQGKTLTATVQEIINEVLTSKNQNSEKAPKSLSRLVQAELIRRLM